MSARREFSAARIASISRAMAKKRLGVKRIMLAILLIAALPAGGLAIGQAVSAYREGAALRETALTASMTRIVDRKRALLNIADTVARFAAPELIAAQKSSKDCGPLLDRLVEANRSFLKARLVDRTGADQCGSPAADSASGDRQTADDRLQIKTLVMSRSLLSEGRWLGEVVITMPMAEIGEGGSGDADFPPADFAVIRSSSAAPGAVEATAPRNEDWFPVDRVREVGLETAPYIWSDASVAGEHRFYGAALFGRGDFVLLASWPATVDGGGLETSTAIGIALPILTWALIFFVVYVAIDRFVIDHIENVTAFASDLKRDLSARPREPDFAPLEFADLMSALGSMATTIDQQNSRLADSLKEKEALLREVYHRVKNNLQLIVSLLNLQNRATDSVAAQAALAEAQTRVQSLALIHGAIYQKDKIDEIRLDEILRSMLAAHNARPSVEAELALEPLVIDIDRIAPVALLINEAFSEAGRCAVEDGADMRFSLALSPQGEGALRLTATLEDKKGALETQEETLYKLAIPPFRQQLMEAFARQLRAEMELQEYPHRILIKLDIPNASA